ncbi:MAG: 3-hydroxyacyl-ACP dehydratase FabZ [Proteobacteria bacterium]|nr:3-hydroxyacyl-ACP dehydratase FabZ [Pseudomonadota bacterium]
MSEKLILPLDVEGICKVIPHRYPFLFVDRVTALDDGKWIEGYKNISFNEPYIQGHFPGRPIVPGVVILEAMAQMGVLFAKLSTNGVDDEALLVFSGAEDVRFRRPVVPGDKLCMRMELIKSKFGHWKMKALATVDGEKAAEGILTATEVR